MVVERGSDEWWWRSSGGGGGSGGEGSGEGDLSAVGVARVVELQWIGSGTVGGLALNWWWQGQGCWR